MKNKRQLTASRFLINQPKANGMVIIKITFNSQSAPSISQIHMDFNTERGGIQQEYVYFVRIIEYLPVYASQALNTPHYPIGGFFDQNFGPVWRFFHIPLSKLMEF